MSGPSIPYAETASDRCSRARNGRFFYPLAALLAGFIFAGTVAVSAPLRPDMVVAVVFSPFDRFDRQMEILAKADGRFYGTGGFSNIVFARSGSPEFEVRLKRAGAWAVLDPVFFRGCSAGAARRVVPTGRSPV